MHALVEAAGRHGELPAWAWLSEARRAHVGRVADLMGDWADRLALSESDRIRWRAAGLLHDVLKDAEPDDLKNLVTEDWPLPLLHAPAAAEMRTGGCFNVTAAATHEFSAKPRDARIEINATSPAETTAAAYPTT